MTKWAALVYGRTYEVDFRFLALPKDLVSNDNDLAWVEEHILATTRMPEKLEDGPRWALFQNERHCVVGVACMVQELVGAKKTDSDITITHDNKKRPLYLFAGYIAERGSTQPSLTPFREHKLDIFHELWKEVRRHWKDKSYYEVKSTESSYKQEFAEEPQSAGDTQSAEGTKLVQDGQSAEGTKSAEDTQSVEDTQSADSAENTQSAEGTQSAEDRLSLNTDPDCVWLWPKQEQATVWQMAIDEAQKGTQTSVCLGLASKKKAKESPYLNGTSSDVERFIKLDKDPRMAYWQELKNLEKRRRDLELSKEDAQQIEREYKYWCQILDGKVDPYLNEVQQRLREEKGKRVEPEALYREAQKFAYANGQPSDYERRRLEIVRKHLGLQGQEAKQIEDKSQQTNAGKSVNSRPQSSESRPRKGFLASVEDFFGSLMGSGEAPSQKKSNQTPNDKRPTLPEQEALEYGFRAKSKEESKEDSDKGDNWF